jgi:hypothetical protein
MPTGYTAKVKDGNVSFRDYALDCARAFGALVEMRDEPLGKRIPSKFKPSPYHSKQLSKARRELQTAQNMTDVRALELAERQYDEALQDYNTALRDVATTTERYVKMRAKAKAWKAPTSEHTELREFMISQLEQSIDFDCRVHSEIPKRMKPQEYRAMLIKQAERNLEYHTEKLQEEVERVQGRTEWVKQLRKSLPKK